MQRELRLDAIRGFLLAEITLVHTGSPLSTYVNEFFGRVSMAAAFIFLSGLVAGLVYGKLADRSMTVCTKAAVQRAFFIHRYHVATFLLLCLIALLVPASRIVFHFEWINDPAIAGKTVFDFLVLAYQPEFFDILPLYTVFVLAMPLALLGFSKGKASVVMTVSLGLWLLAQTGVGSRGAFGGSFFNPFAWQLLFFSGLYFGYFQLHRNRSVIPLDWRLIALAGLIVVLGFTLRWGLIAWPGELQRGTLLSSKMTHSVIYTINFAAFVYLVWWIAKDRPRFLVLRPLVFLGQHSIQVFSFHILVVYLTRPLMQAALERSSWLAILLGFMVVASLFIPAALHQWLLDRAKPGPEPAR